MMVGAIKVRLSAELMIGDVVRTPAGHEAVVERFVHDRVLCLYLDARLGHKVNRYVPLKAEWLHFLRHGDPHVVPQSFFKEEKRHAAG